MMNPSLFHLTEFMVSWFLIIMGASLLLQHGMWAVLARSWVNDTAQHTPLILLLLMLGLFIIFSHNDWSMKPEVIVTFIGWAIVLKSTLFLIMPGLTVPMMPKSDQVLSSILRIAGIIYILIGAWLVYRIQLS